MTRRFLFLAAIAGITAVILGAFGAHALKDTLAARSTTAAWQTAVLYHLVHAIALLGVGLFSTANLIDNASARAPVSRWFGRAAICWATGIVLFSGSLYVLAVGGPRWLGPITPLGGVALIAGWGCLFLTQPKAQR